MLIWFDLRLYRIRRDKACQTTSETLFSRTYRISHFEISVVSTFILISGNFKRKREHLKGKQNTEMWLYRKKIFVKYQCQNVMMHVLVKELCGHLSEVLDTLHYPVFAVAQAYAVNE